MTKISKSFKSKEKVLFSDADDWNKRRKDVLGFLFNNLKSSPYYIGFGVPLRTPSYIFGYQTNKTDQESRPRKSEHKRRRSENRKKSEDYSER